MRPGAGAAKRETDRPPRTGRPANQLRLTDLRKQWVLGKLGVTLHACEGLHQFTSWMPTKEEGHLLPEIDMILTDTWRPMKWFWTGDKKITVREELAGLFGVFKGAVRKSQCNPGFPARL